ncbi:MAG: hypothetical protein U0797_11690 [Gemmataceae bacterium]
MAGSCRGGVNAEAKRLQDKVRDRLLAGFYPAGQAKYDPKGELSRTQVYQSARPGCRICCSASLRWTQNEDSPALTRLMVRSTTHRILPSPLPWGVFRLAIIGSIPSHRSS